MGDKSIIKVALYDACAAAEEAAAAVGCRVVYPEPNQLQLDLDSEEAYRNFKRRFSEIRRAVVWGVSAVEKVSKSGLPHRHIYITCQGAAFSPWQRIALQFALGSDPTRECLSVYRLLVEPEKQPSRLFEPVEGTDG